MRLASCPAVLLSLTLDRRVVEAQPLRLAGVLGRPWRQSVIGHGGAETLPLHGGPSGLWAPLPAVDSES